VNYAVLSAAGNTFAVVDLVHGEAPRDPQRAARELCEASANDPTGHLRLDGLLLVRSPAGEGDCRMEIYNADGSRPEACGNGLRCVARFARERGMSRSDLVRVETDSGLRRVQLTREHDRIVAARATMGVPRLDGLEVELETPLGAVSATLIDMGNPHCVIFVPDVREAPVGELGPILERHPRFPQRTNVEFVTPRARTAKRRGRIAARVWERGVGETAACGTGACAAAVAAALSGRSELPTDVELPGGVLEVSWDGRGEVELAGPCEELGAGEWRERPVP